jgi:ornithine cyclodeaminase/alanine dehydrogenase-like protein (mu-crystallin family)
LATTILADPKSTNLAIFGSGTQAYYHARTSILLSSHPSARTSSSSLIPTHWLSIAGLILELFPSIITTTFIVRSLTSRSSALIERVEKEFGPKGVKVEAVAAGEAKEKVKEADIICTYVLFTRLGAGETLKSREFSANDRAEQLRAVDRTAFCAGRPERGRSHQR